MTDTPEEQDELLEILGELDELVAEDPAAALELYRALSPEFREMPEVLLARAAAVASVDDLPAALPLLQGLVKEHPDYADAHHALALVHEELGDERAMRRHFLQTWEIDAHDDEREGLVSDEARDHIIAVAAGVLESLPDEFRQRLGHVPVVVDDRPDRSLVEEGFDPRAYGLFEGLQHARDLSVEAGDRVTRVVIFAANLLADFEPGEELDEEVRITVLHEVGHFFGLEEDDMHRLGLE